MVTRLLLALALLLAPLTPLQAQLEVNAENRRIAWERTVPHAEPLVRTV